jgi:hypothetical protein
MPVFNVRVLFEPLVGCAEDGISIDIRPGVYKAHHEGNTLVFLDADPRMRGTVTVDLGDYVDIGIFPDELPRNSRIQII